MKRRMIRESNDNDYNELYRHFRSYVDFRYGINTEGFIGEDLYMYCKDKLEEELSWKEIKDIINKWKEEGLIEKEIEKGSIRDNLYIMQEINYWKINENKRSSKMKRIMKEPIEIFSDNILNNFANKIVFKFRHTRKYDEFMSKVKNWIENGFGKLQVITPKSLSTLGYNEKDLEKSNENYNEALIDYIDRIWDYLDAQSLQLINSVEIPRPSFSKIGYFGDGTYEEAKEIAENNSEGWRIPSKNDATFITDNCEGYVRLLDLDSFRTGNFYFWINKSMTYSDNIGSLFTASKNEYCSIFLVR